ncbi:kunitz-type serine protease inhibitor textilinin-2-like [Eublepharis macularius]|uniref:Kunitz-type serine protease inhibitor textilinin-2-like n=1 Tax=Eublepharis macularius TaxID=481883 RepID=A0AA97JDV6_EUBMA|nr:kunitz-type serine protease inhibitor textilinin-2-like [Eublepharis macularius]
MRRSGLLLLVGLLVFWAELAPGTGQTSPPAAPSHQCLLPPDTGPCKANTPHYYYNTIQQRCLVFVYRGCKGNSNNFKTKEVCEEACIEVCKLPKDSGPCEALFERYYYDSASRTCKKFVYGGCRGNGNRFATWTGCMTVCGNQCKG